MKKLLFATITFLSISASAFANVTPIKGKEINSGIQVKTRMLSADIPDCRYRGGNCTITITINGYAHKITACCGDIQGVVIT